MPAAFAAVNVSGTPYVFFKDRTIQAMTGALSMTQEDVAFYDGSTHSVFVDAALMGNPHIQAPVLNGAETAYTAGGTNTHISFGNSAGVKGAQIVATSADDALAGDRMGVVDANMGTKADLTPAQTIKADTLFRWWSGALSGSTPTGSLIGCAWKSQIKSIGPAAPTMLT